jgi:hypothetical protein
MRLRHGKWWIAAGLLAGGVAAFQARPAVSLWVHAHQFRIERFEEVSPSPVYFLQTNRWLEFDIPRDAPLARLVSNASISSGTNFEAGTEWPYAIEYELQGSEPGDKATGVYHFKGQPVVFLDPESGKRIEVNSYLDRRYTPLGGRHWMVNLRDPLIKNAQVLRLRLHSSDPELREVAVRVYFRTAVAERKVAYLWDRMSEDQKRDLARGNIYSYEGLSADEKLCLVSYHWEVASPDGIPGRDFQRRTLYVRDDSERLQELKDWEPAGLALDTEHFGVLPITNAPGHCQLQLIDYESGAVSQVVSNTILWHPQRQPQIETNHLAWSGANFSAMPSDQDGFLQINSSRPVYLRAFQIENGRTNEITPRPDHVLLFACSPTNSVEYDIEHVGDEPTFFRLDVRRFGPAINSNTTDVIHYAMMTEEGDTLDADEVVLTNAISPYDWLVGEKGHTNVTVPQSLCFVFPHTVRTLRISSPRDGIFVNAYSRPSQLVKYLKVPEDYSVSRMQGPAQPSWFTVRPRDTVQRREAEQTGIVLVQARPPEYDPLVQAGQYEWDSFLPETDARGQMILLPPTEGQPPRPDSFSYFPVAVGDEQRVRFQAQPPQPQVAPTLMLVFTNGTGGSASVSLDGQTILDMRFQSPVTAVQLGNLRAGEHRLRISASAPVQAYVNNLESATNTAYLQRYCTMASSNVLSFAYTKQRADSELLVLRIFSPVTTNPQPYEVRFKLKPSVPPRVGPFPALTFAERKADVTPGAVGQTWLVSGTPALLDEGEPVFFPIGPDLPPGRYQVEVRVTAPSVRWLSLSRTTPGVAEKLRLSTPQHVY